MCSFGSCQTRFEFLSQFRKVRNAFECFVAQVQTQLPKTKRVWPMKINVICTVCHVYNVRNLIKNPTCRKSTRGTLLDPVIVSNKNRFSTSFNLTCGFSDFHNLVGCVTKLTMPCQTQKKKHFTEHIRILMMKYLNRT